MPAQLRLGRMASSQTRSTMRFAANDINIISMLAIVDVVPIDSIHQSPYVTTNWRLWAKDATLLVPQRRHSMGGTHG